MGRNEKNIYIIIRFYIFCFAVKPYFGLQLSIALFFARWPSLSIRVELKTGYVPFYNQNSQVIKNASFTHATKAVTVVVVIMLRKSITMSW